jgi:hypothetical protein
MKRLLLCMGAACLLFGAVAFSQPKPSAPEFAFKLEERNPVSHLRLNNSPEDFHFAIVSDRTGGHRARIFSQAIEQINLLQPQFVVTVGDLIEGYSVDQEKLMAEWRDFQGYLTRLQMPFFYVPGNHDISNLFAERAWKEKFGRRYYHFVYRDVLFLMLCSEDPPGKPAGAISPEQQEYVRQTLQDNSAVRWTVVFVHRPIWTAPEPEKTGWLEVENLLRGRPYTVFAGHLHRYQKYVRNGMNYYQLATTGGASRLRGMEYGEFDHFAWVTMKKEGPVLANIMLDGVFPEDLKKPLSVEDAAPIYNRKPTNPTTGTVLFEGTAVPGAYVVFQTPPPAPIPPAPAPEKTAPADADKPPSPPAPPAPSPAPPPVRGDAFTQADGSFTLSTYTANDGIPAGEYLVTIVWRKPFMEESGKPGPNFLPEAYSKTQTTPLRAIVKPGVNTFTFEVKR